MVATNSLVDEFTSEKEGVDISLVEERVWLKLTPETSKIVKKGDGKKTKRNMEAPNIPFTLGIIVPGCLNRYPYCTCIHHEAWDMHTQQAKTR
ncbi:hypothetical protein MGYG_05030 [Nannizzia gypsea CBS 118893]|uniref:Uncharacterized protein n=1 Tax=Arthroderma gypseum (strain ATCC MYA-4604 / CBS 118893) TaxID=535722 RepID=E4UY65_ARTGP|nr:hypothetical protein MGYG_05030 [Nannizzia gypsea CBS 118893]EFR02028.1 hypothetical protein MGYG_05030 [Nannizzia gypsea CBS 118893]